MKNYIRTAAACVAVALVPALAQASEALIDFETLTVGDPVGAAYATSGVTFTNEADSKVVSGLDSMDPSVNGLNAHLTSTAGGEASFTMVIDPSVAQFDALQLLYLGSLQISFLDTNGASQSYSLTAGTGWTASTQFSLDPTAFGLISEIQFTTDANATFKEFAVDNVQLSLLRSVIINPNPVPEPGTFGLAALALLGAGLASRRRG